MLPCFLYACKYKIAIRKIRRFTLPSVVSGRLVNCVVEKTRKKTQVSIAEAAMQLVFHAR